jgi:histidine triad (HIT) family protein
MSETIFHKIIRREIPADVVYEDDHLIAFRDIAPQAPVHVLFVPKTDVATLNDLQEDQAQIVGRLAYAAAQYARREGFSEDGYRIVMNCNGHGGQTVFQIHLHLLAGAPLGRFGTPH